MTTWRSEKAVSINLKNFKLRFFDLTQFKALKILGLQLKIENILGQRKYFFFYFFFDYFMLKLDEPLRDKEVCNNNLYFESNKFWETRAALLNIYKKTFKNLI